MLSDEARSIETMKEERRKNLGDHFDELSASFACFAVKGFEEVLCVS